STPESTTSGGVNAASFLFRGRGMVVSLCKLLGNFPPRESPGAFRWANCWPRCWKGGAAATLVFIVGGGRFSPFICGSCAVLCSALVNLSVSAQGRLHYHGAACGKEINRH